MEQKKQVRISVRALVEFVLRSGDIDNRRSGAAQKDAMAAGTRIHKKIQKRMGGNYRAEVPLKYAALDEEEDIELLVEGRADGIFEEDGIVTIDEIKGVYMDLERLDRAGGGAYGPGHVLRIFLLLRPESGRCADPAYLL